MHRDTTHNTHRQTMKMHRAPANPSSGFQQFLVAVCVREQSFASARRIIAVALIFFFFFVVLVVLFVECVPIDNNLFVHSQCKHFTNANDGSYNAVIAACHPSSCPPHALSFACDCRLQLAEIEIQFRYVTVRAQ